MNKLSICALIVGLFMASCGKVPVAAFKASSTNVYPNDVVTFTASSTDAKSQAWSFGDGATSIEVSATHAYTTSGTYLVNYSAFSGKKENKKNDAASVMITVWPISHKYVGGYNYVSSNWHTNSSAATVSHTGSVDVGEISTSGLLKDNEVYVQLPGAPFGLKATVTATTMVFTTQTYTETTYDASAVPSPTTTVTTWTFAPTSSTVNTDGSIHYIYMVTRVMAQGSLTATTYETYDAVATKI